MRSWKKPTPEQVSRAIAQLGRPELYRYFFDRLENPYWVGHLAQRGYFKQPPQAVHDPVAKTVAFPPWPESRYLVRMARYQEAQEEVLRVALDIPDTDNVRVHEDIVEIALNLPAHMAVELVPKAKRWVRSPYHLLLPSKLGSLIRHLARGGEGNAALGLARDVFALRSGRKGAREDGESALSLGSSEPQAYFDAWEYREILGECLHDLVEATGCAAFELFCDLLESGIRLYPRFHERRKPPEDYSHVWRPAIEEHAQNHPYGVMNALVAAVRDAGEKIIGRDQGQLRALVALLESRPWKVFWRVALHLLRRFPRVEPGLVAERLTNRGVFDDPTLRHEYALLSADCFSQLTEDQQSTILSWVDEGPDLARFREYRRKMEGAEPSDSHVCRFKMLWQRDRLAPLAASLPAQWKYRYDKLVEEVGPPKQPEFLVYSESWVGPTSPKSREELLAMPVEDVLGYLRTWEPPGGNMDPAPEELGRIVAEVVASVQERFAEHANKLEGLDPTYVRHVMGGFREAIRQGRSFDWEPVLSVALWVVGQPREIPGRSGEYADLDPGWVWTRQAIADLLSSGLDPGPCEIPWNFRELVWSTLRPLTDDPQPDPQFEAEFGGTNMDSATLSINTVRGAAMHAVIRYALWVHRHGRTATDGSFRPPAGLALMPEVREVLEAHLDPLRDPSLATRAVYGQWFPWLVLIDPEWAASQVCRIFPRSEAEAPLRDAAWETYVVLCQPYDSVWEILREEYQLAIERLGADRLERRRLADPEERLAEHLMILYWRGKLELEEPEGVLARFYEKAGDSLRAHAVGFIGRALCEPGGKIPPPVVERLKVLWASRVSAARCGPPTSFALEIPAFGWWFVSGAFDDSWALGQLREVVDMMHNIEPLYQVAKRLGQVAPAYPTQAVQCLAAMVQTAQGEMMLESLREPARLILEAAMHSASDEARTNAVGLIHWFGAHGVMDFRDLLPPRNA